ncbi:MAG: hypothetical protein JSV00_03300 [bacterium]|nr:MAG: hypothetical protein JSV00_03300 [bacterium]
MIRDHDAVRRFEDALAREEGRLDHGQALELFTRLWEEGRALGVLPPADPLEGIETDLAMARILNSCSRS